MLESRSQGDYVRLPVLLFLAGSAMAQAPASAPSGQPAGDFLKSVGTMSELMIDIIFPTSNEVFYVGRNEKKTEKDWEDLQNNALILAESANLLIADNRAKDKDRWMADAKLLRDVGSKAFKLAKAKDLEGLKGLNDDLYEACQSCHEHYRPGYKRRL
jgi:hypothetical protein